MVRLTAGYDFIANGYRRKPWPIVTKVLGSDALWFGDLGSGPGQNAVYLISLRSELRGVIVDISEEMLLRFLKEVPWELSCRLYPVLADMEYLPLRSDSLDGVLLIASLHHVTSRSGRLQVLRECYRVLKCGGMALAVVWSRWQLSLILEVLRDFPSFVFRRKESLWDFTKCSRIACREYHLYSLRELVKDLRVSGFKTLEKGIYVPQSSGRAPAKNYYCLSIKPLN